MTIKQLTFQNVSGNDLLYQIPDGYKENSLSIIEVETSGNKIVKDYERMGDSFFKLLSAT